jgi:hypothetical protein
MGDFPARIGQEDCLLNGIIAVVSGFVLGVQAWDL